MSNLIKAAVLTTGRQDYGVLRSTLKLLSTSKDFELVLLVGGMHLSDRYGLTVGLIEADRLPIARRLNWIERNGREPTTQEQSADTLRLVSAALSDFSPDFLFLVGDRFETAAAAFAAVLSRIPLVHLHGGEETVGAIDNQFRHAITKMSHLHLVSHSVHAKRVMQMGELPETVFVVGAPGLDNLARLDLLTKQELEKQLNMALKPPLIIVTLHPTTAITDETYKTIDLLLQVMNLRQATYIITLPNNDPGNELIRMRFRSWVEGRENARAVNALGERAYFGLMRIADLMVGNSSSGLVEAGAYQLPVIDIGSRQQGRLRGPNVLHADPELSSLNSAFEKALSKEFKISLQGTFSIYGDGNSSSRIVNILRNWNAYRNFIPKKFNELDSE